MAKKPRKPLKVLVCGGRDFKDASFVFNRLLEYEEHYGEFGCIIHGVALGADELAGEYAKCNGIPCTVYKAYWNTYGKAAGPIRNKRMLEEGKPDIVIAFPGGRGTANMIQQAHAHGVPVIDVERDPWPDLELK